MCVCLPGYPTQAHSTTNYSSWCLSKNPTIYILHLEIYYIPFHWAEGQREHFCESYFSGFLHPVKCTFMFSEMSETDRPAPLPCNLKWGWPFYPVDTLLPLGSGTSQEAIGRLLQRSWLCSLLSWWSSDAFLPLTWLLTLSCQDFILGPRTLGSSFLAWDLESVFIHSGTYLLNPHSVASTISDARNT